MLGIVGVGKTFHMGSPPGGGHRDAEVVEYRPAADQRLPSGGVRMPGRAVRIEEQVDGLAVDTVDEEPPRLAVVQ